MTKEQTAEPPSCLQAPLFMVGQDRHGNWVVRDQSGTRGGLFVDRLNALCYVRSENANCDQVYVAVSGTFELEMRPALDVGDSQQGSPFEMQSAREVA